MKINGPNQTNFNPYKKQVQKQQEAQKANANQDKLEISQQAKQMQETNKAQEARSERVAEIKQQVQSGNYKVDAQQTAKNMMNFWANN